MFCEHFNVKVFLVHIKARGGFFCVCVYALSVCYVNSYDNFIISCIALFTCTDQ